MNDQSSFDKLINLVLINQQNYVFDKLSFSFDKSAKILFDKLTVFFDELSSDQYSVSTPPRLL